MKAFTSLSMLAAAACAVSLTQCDSCPEFCDPDSGRWLVDTCYACENQPTPPGGDCDGFG